ncbi:nitrile hydratase subunit beta [Breoghania sp. L-A4]|uniref:nitrile hydratase subunit beta n=1 Tax=Breoghania sp. L-A4 TaxID=2304600 RepID=UPI000E35E0CA|nr:nitrile hydratase subunit beta [Breoghania sp. L-A4]AXS41895.1 nitrile hydratase subunit beta [Breoghania sp. L-A4]
MNGAQDMGGQMGFGPVAPEADEPLFHAAWERRVLALTLAMGATGQWNIDASRHARESIPPADYLSKSYYEIWLAGMEKLLAERDLVSPEELDAGKALTPPRELSRILKAEDVAATLAKGGPADRPVDREALFGPGDAVRTRIMHPVGHTRLPRYARGAPGVIERVHGAHVFPDTNAHGLGENPQWLYSVAFKGTDIWGPDSDPGLSLRLDLWEPYLERT